ncbi:hypothetical protein [Bdellovibrio bacteriovorus]|uniref:hypothetical protein n=1 Tax=Bdellovibrio TaxID=958 RepID=UPI0035A92FD9
MCTFLVIVLTLTISGCTLSSEVSSLLPKTGTVVNVDSSGITVRGVVANDVSSAVIENTPYTFSAVQDGGNVKLIPSQNITLTAGVIYRILVNTAQAQTAFTIKTELPAGAILAFNASSCPTGWSLFDSGKGRVLVGAGSGNTDADGTALTARFLGDIGGREFTTGIPASTGGASDSVPSPLLHLGVASASGRTAEIYNSSADTTISGAKADSNMMPFAVVTYCQKD